MAIESVLAQSYREFELIVVNDGSSDGTLRILESFESLDKRIRIVSHENWGMGRSLNHAISLAEGEWIARIDADDLMEPNRLERQIAFVNKYPDLALTSSLATFIDSDGRPLGQSQPAMTTPEAVDGARADGVVGGIFHPGVLMRKSVVQAVGGYRPEFWPADDVDLWTRIADAGGRILVQPEHLIRYRIHQRSASYRETRELSELVAWIKECTRARRTGRPEPSREEFIRSRAGLPFYRRISESRKMFAFSFYRRSTLAYSMGQKRQAGLYLLVAAAAGSRDVQRQLWWRGIRPLGAKIARATMGGSRVTSTGERE